MSSTRKILKNIPVITSGDMSGNLTSLITNLDSIDQISYVISSVNTNAVGQWSIQASNDGILFVPITFSPVIAATTSGVNDLILIDMKLLSFSYVKAVYTRTSGGGTATVTLSGKGN